MATLDEIAQSGNYSMEDVEEALTMVQEFDPPGVGARDLQECLMLQLKVVDPQNTLAQQIITDHLKLLQNNQLKEVARPLNRPVELVKRAVDVIKRLDPKPGLRYNKTEPRLVEPDVQFRKVDGEWQVFINDDDLPQLRLSPTYRRLLARDAADRDVRNYVKERFTAAIQLMKNIEQRKHTIVRVCNSILRRQGEFPRLRPRSSEADDDQGGRRGSGRPSFHRQPRRGEQIRSHAAGRARAAHFFLRIGQRAAGQRNVACYL